jgi:hypothetical protein
MATVPAPDSYQYKANGYAVASYPTAGATAVVAPPTAPVIGFTKDEEHDMSAALVDSELPVVSDACS